MTRKEQLLKDLKMSRRTMYCALTFVIVSIITMTVAYATLSTTLKITGTAEFQEVSWGFKVEEEPDISYYAEIMPGTIDGNTITNGNGIVLRKPTISGTSLNDFELSFTKPGDRASVIYKITNTGTIPATLESIIYNDPTYTSNTNNQDDIEIIENYFYADANLWELYFEDGKFEDLVYIGRDSILCPGASFIIEIYANFMEEATEVPSSNITISNLNTKFNFVASDNNLCNGSTPIIPNKKDEPPI